MTSLLATLLVTLAASDTQAAEAIDETLLRAPTMVTPTDAAERGFMDAVRTVLDESLSSADRRRLGRKVLSPRRVEIVEGSFAAGAKLLVTVNVELRRPDPDAEPMFISGVFTMNDSGELATIVVPPQMRPERNDLESIGDVDGDGLDDLVLVRTKPDGDTRHLVSLAAGTPTDRVLPPSDFEGC